VPRGRVHRQRRLSLLCRGDVREGGGHGPARQEQLPGRVVESLGLLHCVGRVIYDDYSYFGNFHCPITVT